MARQVDPQLIQAVASQAAAAGMNPVDLLTVIGYETGGTYNPAQPGPHTKWGQHRGLIQFGEQQARDYGVDFAGPVGNQVAAAIKFIQDHGWRPELGRLGMYAAINAGDARKIHASDAKAGGAWGTVADKVNYQMGAHEARAKNLLSQYDVPGGYQPPATGAHGIPGGIDPKDLPWGGGYKPAPVSPPAGVLPPAGVAGPSPVQTPPAAPVAPFSVAPNSDAARMLSDPTRYGLSPEQSQAMRSQVAAGQPGGGQIGNIPAPPALTQTSPAPPAGVLPAPESQGSAATLFDDWKNKRPLGLFQGGWT